MATNRIKGIVIEIGGDSSGLDKVLDDVNKRSRSLSGELGNINRLLKFDPENTQLLTQKQKVLEEQIEATSEKLKVLKETEKGVQQAFKEGRVSEAQVRELKREIIVTSEKLEHYEKVAKETSDTLDRLGDKSSDAAKKTKELSEEQKDAINTANDLSGVVGGALATGFGILTAAATAAIGALVGVAESTREYRTALGKLDTAFETNGHSAEVAYDTYAELQGILGETDQAVEASNHLAKLADTEKELQEWTEICTGVFATFGDSLPIENITEAANETAKTGKIVGGLADALNWAGKSEDKFQEQLDKCTNEQERQALITETLVDLYGDAADAYKDTNKEVIAANKANEKWNRALAKSGKHIEPVITEVKEMGAAILEDMSEPMEDAAEYLTDTVLPALRDFGGWAKQNVPLIKAGLAGIASGMVAYKVAAYSAQLATEGLTLATKRAEIAQKALAVAQAATPWAAIGLAVGAVVGAIVYFSAEAEKAAEKVDVLTEEERKLVEQIDETAQAYRDRKTAMEESMAGIEAEMGHVSGLARELQTLADAKGNVQEKDEARVQFILNELNEALGTEYQMIDGQIQGYGKLADEIDRMIESKKAQLLLAEMETAYVEAIKGEKEAWEQALAAEKDYLAQKAVTQQAEQEYLEFNEQYQARLAEAKTQSDFAALGSDARKVSNLKSNWEKLKTQLDEAETKYNDAANTYGGMVADIKQYEDASVAYLGGKYQEAEAILRDKSGAYSKHADAVYTETQDVLKTLEYEAQQAAIKAADTKTGWENGVAGYTEDMVKEAQDGFEAAFEKYQKAYEKAYGVGGDMGGGLNEGLAAKKAALLSTAQSMVNGVFSTWRQLAQIKSPSRVAKKIFGYIGEGAVVSMEDSTEDMVDTAEKQMQALMNVYRDDIEGQNAFRDLATLSSRNQAQNYQTLASDNASMLGKIYQAIKDGQVLALDGDKLVGGTAARMDNKMGQTRVLVERGAL